MSKYIEAMTMHDWCELSTKLTVEYANVKILFSSLPASSASLKWERGADTHYFMLNLDAQEAEVHALLSG